MMLTSRFFADILLTPLEATRIRLVSDRNVGILSLVSASFARFESHIKSRR